MECRGALGLKLKVRQRKPRDVVAVQASGPVDYSRARQCRVQNGTPFLLKQLRCGGEPIHVIQKHKHAEASRRGTQKIGQGCGVKTDPRNAVAEGFEMFALQIVRTAVRRILSVDVNPPEIVLSNRNCA